MKSGWKKPINIFGQNAPLVMKNGGPCIQAGQNAARSVFVGAARFKDGGGKGRPEDNLNKKDAFTIGLSNRQRVGKVWAFVPSVMPRRNTIIISIFRSQGIHKN